MPFDANVNDFLLWEQAVKLLNGDGEPLVAVSSDPVKKYYGIEFACPYKVGSDTVIIVYNSYSISSELYIRIYRWSKVGVLLSQVDVNLAQAFKDTDYNINFNRTVIFGDGIYTDGCIDIIGYTSKKDDQFNEQAYTSIWGKLNADMVALCKK